MLQNCHFAGNSTVDKSEKGYKIWSIIVHFNAAFTDVSSDEAEGSIDDYLTKFKGPSSTTQHLQLKPIKWGVTGAYLEYFVRSGGGGTKNFVTG